jgi:uncharacterized membrane protein
VSADGLTPGRLEAFSDAVMAIAITLLVLPLGESGTGGSLTGRLANDWPLYVSYLLSFVNIGTIWLNHHSIVSRVRTVDHGLVLLNLLLLLVVAVFPFPTKVLGESLHADAFADQRAAALLYTSTFLAAATAFCALWLGASQGRRLIRDEMGDQAVRLRTGRMVLAVPLFSIPCLLAVWHPIAAVALDGGIIATFLVSDGWLERRAAVGRVASYGLR